jgi:hypothetical protein
MRRLMHRHSCDAAFILQLATTLNKLVWHYITHTITVLFAVVRTPALSSWDLWFKSQLGDRLFWQTCRGFP